MFGSTTFTCAPGGTLNQISSTLRRAERHSRKIKTKKQTEKQAHSSFNLHRFSFSKNILYNNRLTFHTRNRALVQSKSSWCENKRPKSQTTARLRKSTNSFRTQQKLISTTRHWKYNKPDDSGRPSFTTVCSTKTKSFSGRVCRDDDDVCRVENFNWICIFSLFFCFRFALLSFAKTLTVQIKLCRFKICFYFYIQYQVSRSEGFQGLTSSTII